MFRSKLTYSNVVSTLCLFIVLGGSSYAAVNLGRNSVKGKNIASNAVSSPKVMDGSLLGRDFKAGQLPVGPMGGQGPKGDPGAKGDQGAKGDRGTPGQNGVNGATNVTIRTATGLASTTESTVAADCLSGEVATGGGALADTSAGALAEVIYSRPVDAVVAGVPSSWNASVRNVGTTGSEVTIHTYVVCAAP